MFVLGMRWLIVVGLNITGTFASIAVAIGYFIVTILGVMFMHQALKMKYRRIE